jgi:hypothetical protein
MAEAQDALELELSSKECGGTVDTLVIMMFESTRFICLETVSCSKKMCRFILLKSFPDNFWPHPRIKQIDLFVLGSKSKNFTTSSRFTDLFIRFIV